MNALIFDMDGVVVDSVGYWNAIRERIIQSQLGLNDVNVNELVGMNASDEYDYLAERNNLNQSKDSYISLIEDHEREVYQKYVSVFPEIETILKAADKNGVHLGMVSSSHRQRIEMVFDRFDLTSYFNVVVGGDDLDGPSKPDPAIYEYAISQLQLDAGECVTVEDSEHGVTAAKRAGIYCIGYAIHPGQPLDGADEIYQSDEDLRERLVELCQNKFE